jgi:8-oxo-dGTP diphosphatase
VRRVVHLIRHAHAGDRAAWSGDDSQRPLSPKGWRQAEGIAEFLANEGIRRVLSSPSLRCVQTVEPLAARLGLDVEVDDALLEGSDPAETLEMLEAVTTQDVVAACTHGDIIPGVLDLLRARGVTLDGPATWPKASTWVLSAGPGDSGFEKASFLPAP